MYIYNTCIINMNIAAGDVVRPHLHVAQRTGNRPSSWVCRPSSSSICSVTAWLLAACSCALCFLLSSCSAAYHLPKQELHQRRFSMQNSTCSMQEQGLLTTISATYYS